MKISAWTALCALVSPLVASAQTFTPGVPTSQTFPNVNSIRPGVIAPVVPDEEGNLPEPTAIKIYGLGYADIFFSGVGTLGVTWNGEPLEFVVVASAPDTQIVASVPAAYLLEPGAAEVVVSRSGEGRSFESDPVVVTIGEPPSCEGEGAECGAALGTIPVFEILPTRTWYPLVTAPPGGLVRVENHDHLAPHTFTSAATPGFTADGRFHVALPAASAPDQPAVGYARTPEDAGPLTPIPFFCELHTALMAPPTGELLIE